jgi:hypothetical protein
MDMIGLENSFGVASVVGALAILIGVKGAKPHELTTLLVGVILMAIAAMTAATFSNFAEIAKLLRTKRLIGDFVLDSSLRINNLWVLIYPAFVGAIGVNLLTSWFQSSGSKEDKEPIGTLLSRRLPQESLDAGSHRIDPKTAIAPRRVRKNVRATLARKR